MFENLSSLIAEYAQKIAARSIDLAQTFDVLIVGAGPAGTAAAFRARELGLAALVIDQEAVLKVLRDWIECDDKKVDSSFGPGGRRVAFPTGGGLVDELVFGDQIPASRIYTKWLDVYIENDVPAKPGLELARLERGADDTWACACIDRSRDEVTLRARAVVLAMGRGVPVQLDMPGDTRGINYVLKKTETYVGGPSCVIGGGTSAAEAVIEISNAKVEAGDETDVFWSYRRRSLPKVNSTLATRFFQAYLGNGNIRYLPLSQPIAVLREADGSEFLALRSDRIREAGRPVQGSYLEFPKERVLACIGADLPVGFLRSCGIERLTAADSENEKFLPVTPLLESAAPNIFMIGDLLSPAYIQTHDFTPEAVQSAVIDHQGNFKMGMIDGVLAIESIQKRLREGKSDENIATFLEELRAEYRRVHKERLESQKAEEAMHPARGEKPEPVEVAPRLGAAFALVVEEDGRDRVIDEYLFPPGRVLIGKTKGDLTFPEDDDIADDQVALVVEADGVYASNEKLPNERETWVDIRSERTVRPGAVFIAGSHRLQVQETEDGVFLAILGGDDRPKTLLPVFEEERVYGRQQTASCIAIDPSDEKLSRRHFCFSAQDGVCKLRDFGSRNHTYHRVSGALRLNAGDIVIAGGRRLLFRGLETGRGEARAKPTTRPEATAAAARAPPKAPAAAPASAAPPGEAAVLSLEGAVVGTLVADAERTILAQLKQQGLATKDRSQLGGRCHGLYSCEAGTCGQCIVRVTAGGPLLSKLGGKEKRTLKTMVEALNEDQGRDLELAECRLGCMASVERAGGVRIELQGDTE